MKYYYRLLSSRRHIERLNFLLLAFAILFAFLIIIPAFLDDEFIFCRLIKNGDVLDLFIPLILIPLYWSLFKIHPDSKPSPRETLIFLILAAMWVQGQGMHLAANSTGYWTKDIADTSDLKTVIHFYDEVLSHYWWHCGLIGLSALLIYRQWHNPFGNQYSGLKWEIGAGIIHGFNYFIDVVESATTFIGVPFAAIVVVLF